jgi:energy-coupling factor transporter ATP-binding protein EcfA2
MDHRYFMRKQVIAWVICLGLILPVSLVAREKVVFTFGSQEESSQELQLQHEKLSFSDQTIAEYVLNIQPHAYKKYKSIITQNEWDELQIDHLIEKLCKPETSFGFAGLQWLLQPIADKAEILRRQTMIKSLVDDQKMFADLQAILHDIKKGEHAILSYWAEDLKKLLDSKKQEEGDPMSSFLYKIPFFRGLNKFPVALELGVGDELRGDLARLATGVCLYHVYSFMMTYVCFRAHSIDPTQNNNLWLGFGSKDNFTDNVKHALWKGYSEPLRKINPYTNKMNPDELQKVMQEAQQYNTYGKTQEEAIKWMYFSGEGTLGDQCVAWWMMNKKNGSMDVAEKSVHGLHLLLGGIFFIGVPTLWFYKNVYQGISVAYKNLTYTWRTLQEGKRTLFEVASLLRSLKKLELLIKSVPILQNSNMSQYVAQVMNKKNWSPELEELMELLHSPTFDSQDGLIYSRGKAIRAHFLLKEVKNELVPALQAIADFDAYLTLAKMYKEHQGSKNPFVFVEFIDNPTPKFVLRGCWEPLVDNKKAQANDIILGDASLPIRWLITGPNGGGKSTTLKSFGRILMGQACGMIPAKKAQMTLIHGLRTSLDPREDISKGISTFMAQKKRIGEINDFIKKSSINNKVVVLLDEPYRGTVDEETADRIYMFGTEAVKLPHAVVLIATHVKKPLQLEQDTKGAFANYHIEIQQLRKGQFKRTFKLAKGPATDWFEDGEFRRNFVDWLDVEQQRQTKQAAAAA